MENDIITLKNHHLKFYKIHNYMNGKIYIISYILIIIFLLILYLSLCIELKIIRKDYSQKLSELKVAYSENLSEIEKKNSDKISQIIEETKKRHNQQLSEINSNFSNILSKIKIEYKNEINFHKKMLQLYIENRTEFYRKGREKVMESSFYNYNDSNILTIQDKLNWLIIYDNPELKSRFVDKILLHNFSLEIFGKDICVPIIKIYNNVEEIDFNDFPEKFVMKCNHGSGMNIICNDKKIFNFTKTKTLLQNWMNTNFGLNKFEYQYINIKRKILVEQYLGDDILDYKIYCFNGNPRFIRVQKHLKEIKINNYYNLDWTLNEIETNLKNFVRSPQTNFKKPKNLDLMIEYAKRLSSRFIFVRVDLYELNDIIYLGELTFTPSNIQMNLKDKNQSLYLGSLLNINKTKKYI